jgi:hypothetical protein
MNILKTITDSAVTMDSVSTPSRSAASLESPDPAEPAGPRKNSVPTCQIQWIDPKGQPTPDSNLAVGRVRRERYFHTLHGRTMEIPQTEWFYICAHHLHQLKQPGMEHWTFEPLPPDESPAEPSSGLVMDGPPR